jgi:HSP20 family protein
MKPGTAMAPMKNLRERLNPDRFGLLHNRLNRLFGEPFATLLPFDFFNEEATPFTTWTPACDVYETDHEIIIKAELPEVQKENVSVSLNNNVLTIHGERRLDEKVDLKNYHRVERNYGEFLRSFTLPPFIDAEKITPEFKDGLLLITLPKLKEARPKQIEVKVN